MPYDSPAFQRDEALDRVFLLVAMTLRRLRTNLTISQQDLEDIVNFRVELPIDGVIFPTPRALSRGLRN